MGNLTQLLSQIEHGDPAAAGQLLPLVYDELRALAAANMASENPGQTLQATALVHEAFLRLVDEEEASQWESRGHFFKAAATAMRRILIETARVKKAQKRGGDRQRVPLSDIALAEDAPPLLELDQALSALQETDPESAKLVELRYFAGLKMEEAANTLGISVRKAHYLWNYARAWLRDRMRNQ